MMNKKRYIIKYPTGITITDIEPAEVTIKRQKEIIDKILTYAKKQCDDYLKEDDCEYCDGVFASCRKVLQLAGEDISEYK